MVGLGRAAGVRTVALVTAMDRPLGRAAGNAVEVAEAVEVLAGGGPADVVELTLALAREMLAGAGRDDVDPADALGDGRAMDVWRRMIAAQGGDPDAPLPRPAEKHVVTAPATGTLTRLDALAVGVAAWRLGAGRARKEDPVSAAAGVTWTAGVGERVTAGQPLLELHTDDARAHPAGARGAGGGDRRRHRRPAAAAGPGAHDGLTAGGGQGAQVAGGDWTPVTSTSAAPPVRRRPPDDPLDPDAAISIRGLVEALRQSSPRSTGWTSTSTAARSSPSSAPTAPARRRRSRSARATGDRDGGEVRVLGAGPRRRQPAAGRRGWASCCSPARATAS